MLEQDFKRFTAKTSIQPDGCIIWTGGISISGYGNFRYEGTVCRAHRVSFEHWIGPIPDGLQIDHLCRVRACVNPTHLEPVTQRENLARGDGAQASSLRNRPDQTKCGAGLHDWTEDNIYVSSAGKRQCIACHYIARHNRNR